MEFFQPEKIPFQVILEALLNEAKPFPPSYLHRFSDIPDEDLAALKQVWDHVSVIRRRAIMEDLEDLAEADTLVSFEDLGRFALRDIDPGVRILAIRLLWEVDDHHLVPQLIHMLEKDSNHEVRAAAANALGRYVYLGELEEIPADTLQKAEDTLLSILTSQEHPLVRRKALESLGYSGRPEVPSLIQDAYRNGNSEWVASSLFAMGRSADTRWQREVLGMLDNPNNQIREEAVRAAGELGLQDARSELMHLLKEEDNEEVLMAAVWSLSQIGGSRVRDALEQMLEEIEDDDQADFIEEALDNLSFTEEVNSFGLFDMQLINDEEDENQSSKQDGHHDQEPQRKKKSK
jgi:HEAT repeat protein